MRISDWSSDVCSSDLRDDDAALFGQKVRYGKIAFARVVVEAEHPASRWEFRQFLGNGRKSRARRNANQHSFFVCRTQRHFLCIGGFDPNGAVKQLGVQIGRTENSTNSLNRMRPRQIGEEACRERLWPHV